MTVNQLTILLEIYRGTFSAGGPGSEKQHNVWDLIKGKYLEFSAMGYVCTPKAIKYIERILAL